MNPAAHVAAAVNGLSIIESPALKYDEMYISQTMPAIIVGEAAHFVWRLRQRQLNEELRADLRRRIEEWGTSLLGEPWTVTP